MKIARYSCFALGTASLLAALFLVLHNVQEDRKGGEQAQEALAELLEVMPERPTEAQEFAAVQEELPDSSEIPETLPTLAASDDYYYEPETVPPEPVITIYTGTFIGIITIPELELELPVIESWSYPNLKIAPCRYAGSAPGGDLIIAAHNYRSHFGGISALSGGSEIIFTDVEGKAYHYAVTNIEQIPGTSIEQMEFGSADDWDLTLFTCTLNGQSRVTVRAEEIGNAE